MSELLHTIKNKAKRGNYYKTQSSFIVRDYHSYTTSFLRRNDWFVRLWLESKLRSYRAYLVTLTYKPQFHPVLDKRDLKLHRGYFCKGDKYNQNLVLPCFSKSDKTLFFKKLRKRLGNGIKYLIACEYGHNFTCRGHLHVFLMVPSDVTKDVERAVRQSWTYSLRVSNKGNLKRYVNIPLGRVDFAVRNGSAEVISSAGYRYCTKYILKDDYIKCDHRYIEYVDTLKGHLESGSMTLSQYDYHIEHLHQHLPFHVSSKNLGVGWEDMFDPQTVFFKGITIPTYNKRLSCLQDKLYKLPQVLFDRYFFDHNYIKYEEQNLMPSSQAAKLITESYCNGFMTQGSYKQYCSLLNAGYSFDYTYDDTLFKVIPDYKVDSNGLCIPMDITYYYDKNHKRYHYRDIKPDRIDLYVDIMSHNIHESSIKEELVIPYHAAQIEILKWFGLIRNIILPRGDNTYDYLDDYVSLLDLKDIYKNSLIQESHLSDLCSDDDYVEQLLTMGKVISQYHYMSSLERQYQEYIKIKSHYTEKLIKGFAETENMGNLARDSQFNL